MCAERYLNSSNFYRHVTSFVLYKSLKQVINPSQNSTPTDFRTSPFISEKQFSISDHPTHYVIKYVFMNFSKSAGDNYITFIFMQNRNFDTTKIDFSFSIKFRKGCINMFIPTVIFSTIIDISSNILRKVCEKIDWISTAYSTGQCLSEPM